MCDGDVPDGDPCVSYVRVTPSTMETMETMNTPPEGVMTVSPSQLDSWLLCNYRELYRGQPGYDNTSSEAAAFGTGEHGLIAEVLTTGQAFESRDDVLDHWISTMANHPKHPEDITQYASRERLLEIADELLLALNLWVEHVSPWIMDADRLMVEESVAMPLCEVEGSEVWLQGTPDFVVRKGGADVITLIDFKTAGRGWKDGKVLSATQHLTYPWLVNHRLGEFPVNMEYIVYNRQAKEWETKALLLERTMLDAGRMMLEEMAQALYFGVGVHSPQARGGYADGPGWHCQAAYCPAWNICPGKYAINVPRLADKRPETQQW